MYAMGSRQELEALAHHLRDNHRIALSQLADGNWEAAAECLNVGSLITAMLIDAIQDHFNSKN